MTNPASPNIHDIYRSFKKYPFGLQDFGYPMVGRESVWNEIVQRIEESPQKSGNEIIVIRGDYGLGKSFTLAKIHEKFVTKHEFFTPKPMSLLSPEQTSKFSVDLANRLYERIGQDQLVTWVKRASGSWHGRISPKVDDMFSALLADDERDVAKAYQAFLSPKLLPRDGQHLLFGLQFVLAQNNKRTFLWLIDEFEYVLVLGKAQLSRLAQTLREVYDRQTEFENEYGDESAKIVFVFATSPAGWERLEATAEGSTKRAGLTGVGGVGVAPFHRRVSSANIIDLEPLSQAGIRKLIETRMNNRDKSVMPAYIPFTDDFIEYVYEMSKGRPSQLIMLCDVIFLEAGKKKLREVDQVVAKDILIDLGLRAEPE
jgi:hypothetical protein